MSRSPLKFWTVIVLILLRLALGESVHAMPHDEGAQQQPAAEKCPEHSHESGAAVDEAAPDHPAPDNDDCCKDGLCECPCLHAPCATTISAIPLSSVVRSVRSVLPDSAIEHDRLTALLRPPA